MCLDIDMQPPVAVRIAAASNFRALLYVNESLTSDDNFIRDLVTNIDGRAILFASPNIRSVELLKMAIDKDPYAYLASTDNFDEDFQNLLFILRRYAKPDSKMLFTCFIDNEMLKDFEDRIPEKPLLRVFYRENFIRQMLELSDWQVISFHPPAHEMKFHFVCAPQ